MYGNTQNSKDKMFKIGDRVAIVRRSKKYNPSIENRGKYGILEEVWYDGANIQCDGMGGWGAVDLDCLQLIERRLMRNLHFQMRNQEDQKTLDEFMVDINKNPREYVNYLILADWLEENGYHDYPERLRRWEWAEEFLMEEANHAFGWSTCKEDVKNYYDNDWNKAFGDYSFSYNEFLYFLSKHDDVTNDDGYFYGEKVLYFDTPEQCNYSDELWEAYEIVTGQKRPNNAEDFEGKRVHFSCSC